MVARKQMIVNDQVLQIEGLPAIHIECNNQATQYYIDLMVNDIKAQPQRMLSNCNDIYIRDRQTYFAAGATPDSVGMGYSDGYKIELLYDVSLIVIVIIL